ncbi:TK/FER protein kinase [Aphelenchoides avenae]|nr:TK/FER protein kinase [Aphelenchus avenae]
MHVLERVLPEIFHRTALEEQVWYHGLRALEDIQDFLKEPGDFLVRCSQSNEEPKIILNVLVGKGQLSNLVISTWSEASKKQWALKRLDTLPGCPHFDNIVQLVEFYKTHALPGNVKLKRGVPRPEWLIKHGSITFSKNDLIGSGHFCNVYTGRFKSRRVAIKMSIDAPDQVETEVINGRAAMLREARIMASFSHKNVIQFYGVACDHLPILLVMEFCPGGSLEDHLRRITEIGTMERLLYCLEAARGMRYLHHNRCIHKDLATRNCLLNERGVIKIADFGMSEMVYTIRQGDMGQVRLPIRWCAPELLEPGQRMPYSTHSDVWAYGVLIYEVFNNGEEPWPNDHAFKAMAKRIRDLQMPPLPTATPPFAVELVKGKIWVKKPDARPSMADIVEILARHLWTNAAQFPPVAQMAVNKILGVQRDYFLKDDLDTIVRGASVEVLPMSSMTPRKRKSDNHRTVTAVESMEKTTSSKKPAKPTRPSHKPSKKPSRTSAAERTTMTTVTTSVDTTVDLRQSAYAPAPSKMTSTEAKKTSSIETMAKKPGPNPTRKSTARET